MRRREFITLLGGAAAWPLTARAQQTARPLVGFISAGSPTTRPWPQNIAEFRQGLQEAGFVDGQNVTIEYQWAEDQYDRLPGLAADLLQHRAAVIAADPRAVYAAKSATTTVPIVFMSGGDPVRTGLVASLNRPGGNLTGVVNFVSELTAKRLQLLHDLVPQARTIGVLRDSTNSRGTAAEDAQTAARAIGVAIRVVEAGSESEIEAAFATLAREGISALFIAGGYLFYSHSAQLAELARRHRIAASAEARVFVEVGGLTSYGPNETEGYRQVGRYAGRILKGEKPAELPVMQPTKIDFVLNLKTADAIGIRISPNVLTLADVVIE
jgi:putative ABC transport system substrate-binding protein